MLKKVNITRVIVKSKRSYDRFMKNFMPLILKRGEMGSFSCVLFLFIFKANLFIQKLPQPV